MRKRLASSGGRFLVAAVLILFPSVARAPWVPHLTPQVSFKNPAAFVVAEAVRRNVPPALALAVWHVEASRRTNPPDGLAGERGAFQCTRGAAIETGHAWKRMRDFSVSTACGLDYLARSLRQCGGGWLRASNRYNSGQCSRRGQTGEYARKIGRAILSQGMSAG